jgi:CheY-like chemotaxis protein
MLDLFDIEMEVSTSGINAIERIKNGETFDIIFMDHLMPVMDGIETTNAIRATGYKGVIIALTANALVGCAEMFLENGFDDFISKPMDVTRLGVILNKWLRPDE